ncbi:MFS transporter [Streptomyces antioxidans]|uniref:MFS transporter n=1 Tax=Streptomyces antioxidans TaxID=1507734 RepID=A0A1V4DC89_9ACTN|nr:MFS transporter [Streptomyces antioxidans]
MTGAFIAMMDTFIVNVAAPSIQADLRAGTADTELVIAGYTLTYAVGLIAGGRLGDVYGRRRMFAVGLAGFTLASLACGLAASAGELIAARLVQGAAAALLSPQVLAIIRTSFVDRRQRARAFGLMGAVQALASVFGQILGGAVTQADVLGLGWRPVFLINVPIGLAALLLVRRAVPESRAAVAEETDWGGMLFGGVALVVLLVPLIEGQQLGWPGWLVGMLPVAVVVLAVFLAVQVRRARRGAAALLHAELLASGAFTGGAVVVLLFSATMTPLYLGYTILLQEGFGDSPLRAGLAFAPLAMAVAVSSFAAGRFIRRVGRRVVLAAGAVLHGVGGGVALGVSLAAPGALPNGLLPCMVVLGVAQGLFVTPSLNAVLDGVGEAHIGGASGILTAMQRLGNAVGTAVLMLPFLAAYERARAGGAAPAKGYTEAFAALCGAVTLVSLLTAALLCRVPFGRAGAGWAGASSGDR